VLAVPVSFKSNFGGYMLQFFRFLLAFLVAFVRSTIIAIAKLDDVMPWHPFSVGFAMLCPGMASVMLSDAIIPAVYMSYTADDNPELTAFYESGVAVRNELIDSAFNGGGKTEHMPFWKDLDPTIEPNYSTDNPADVAVPNKITSGEQIVRICNLNQGYSAADLVAQLAGSNPMQRIRNRFGTYWTRQFQRRIISTMRGVLAENVAAGASDMVNSVALETTVGVTSANLFSRSNFTGAVFTLGDHFGEIVAIAVHSIVFKRMIDNDDITFERPSTVDPNLPISAGGQVPYFLGKRVIIDDSMPVIAGTTSGFKYVSALFGEGALGYGDGSVPVPVEVYRRPDQGNGGGVEQLWERKGWVLHPFGYKWNEASVAGQSPTLAELATAANWTRVIERKNVPIAFLITNG
jgi:hypothetical protein